MRLISRSPLNKWVVEDFSGTVPFYAILSHTWDHKDDEVTFEDIEQGRRDVDDHSKPGFDKLRFCCAKAEKDGLRYFWIDTCCIKKSDSTELQRSLNSMFYWYQRAVRCYVLLSDVSGITTPGQSFFAVQAFRQSRWFKRGWTLQELIAPSSVVFYSKEYIRLGDKTELVEAVASVTKIPITALQGMKLSRFSIEERFSWADNRKTSVPEDAAYCLLGIFDIRMYPSYADGVESERRKEALYELNKMIAISSKNAEHAEDVIRIGGASWCDLVRLSQATLRELDRDLAIYLHWLLDIFPRMHTEGEVTSELLTVVSETAGKKMKTLLARFGVHYEDLSGLETTVIRSEESWTRFCNRYGPDQVRVQALVENRWYWSKYHHHNENVYTVITAARTLTELMIWREKWSA